MRLVLSSMDASHEIMEAGDYPEALARTESLARGAPEAGLDLILLDLNMPGMPWGEGLERLKAAARDVPIVVLSASDDRRVVMRAVRMGAAGYIPKTSSSQGMMKALELVLRGGVYLPPAMLDDAAATEPSDSPGPVLTPRQREVLSLLAAGKSNKEIARMLDLSEGTVKLHVTAILKALGVANRTSAVVAASQLGLATMDAGGSGGTP